MHNDVVGLLGTHWPLLRQGVFEQGSDEIIYYLIHQNCIRSFLIISRLIFKNSDLNLIA